MINSERLLERFLRYIAVDTQSDPDNYTETPSTGKQFDLAKMLKSEMDEMGIETWLDEEHCYVYGHLKGDGAKRTVGFVAHIDTAPDLDGKCVNPIIHDYEGGDIRLNDDYVISAEVFPEMENYKGQKIITTDGTTLLGADDKAGVAAIMELLATLTDHPELPHGDIAVCFTPDEEIGHGAEYLDLDRFGADFAYTVDGGEIGGMEYETFNAASAKIDIGGRNVHPGSAKGKMINAALIGIELQNMLPVAQRPEYTENHEGFFLLTDIEGTVEQCSMSYIIRDHDREKFEEKKQLIADAVKFLEEKHHIKIKLEVKDSYYNMSEIIEKDMSIVELACDAMKAIGVEPAITPVRGGTDGAQLSFRGLPCPNLFTGGHNYHGRYEFLPIPSLNKATELLLQIARQLTEE